MTRQAAGLWCRAWRDGGSGGAPVQVRREGVNLQVITAEEGKLLWLSPALPGGTHDVKAAREHDIIDTCAQLDIEILADKGYQGAGGTIITPIRRRPGTELPDKHKKSNKVHAGLRAPIERTISRIKQWRIFRHARISPNRLTSAAAAILTLMIYTRKRLQEGGACSGSSIALRAGLQKWSRGRSAPTTRRSQFIPTATAAGARSAPGEETSAWN
ncbi:transposase family protein [Streptomyces sp. 1222.5]|uniref:transposase family protein n=1 Tax=Streptomyces sp. 1222.5 TaxID=1881026 RepID=UPI003D75A8DB